MKKTTLQITGMHCASCATLIARGLSKKQGIKEANVNYSAAKALVTYDESLLDEATIISIIKSKGYGAQAASGIIDAKKQEEMQKKELADMKALVIFSAAFAFPAFIIGMVFMWLKIMLPHEGFILFLLAAPVQFIAGEQFYKGMWSALKNRSANMDSLIAIGTSAAFFFSLYNIIFNPEGGQYFETSAIIITLVLLGKWLEAVAKGNAGDAIKKLMQLSPKFATVVREEKEIQMDAGNLKLGDLVIVKPGESIPIDGRITEGKTSIDESMITGESMPVEKKQGDIVTGGTINKNGYIMFSVTKEKEDTTLAKIIRLIEEAQGKKAPIQRFADEVSAYFVPIVIIIAAITFAAWRFIIGESLSFSIIASVAVLVIACPCALGLATPTAIMVGSGIGAKKGIIIKGGDALETAHKIKYVVFDKTGTITKGRPEVTDAISFDGKDVLQIAASIEKGSEHPLAEAISNAYKGNLYKISDFKALPGKGISAKIGTKRYLLGNTRLMKESNIDLGEYAKNIKELESQGKTVMILSDKKALGLIAVADTIRDDSADAVSEIEKMGIGIYMITGDNDATAKAIAKKAGIKNYFSEVLPDQKADYVKKLQEKGKVAMIGDGINDSPALAIADIGIAMGSGTDIAMESGNIVLMKDSLMDVAKAIKLSRLTMKKIRQNMFWALFYNIMGIPVAAGILYPWTGWLLSPIIAGGAMAFSSVSVLANTLLMKSEKI